MVSTVSILYMAATLAICLLLPAIVLLILMKGRKGVFGVWAAGALGFIVPQLIIRIPAIQMLGTLSIVQIFIKEHAYLYIFILALTAGLFETTGRLLVLKVALSSKLSYMTGLAAGAGHGGIEAITVIGMTYINNIIISLYINMGKLSEIIPGDPVLAESIHSSLTQTPSGLFLIAGFERIFAMMFQIALSLLFTLLIIRKHAVLGFFMITFCHFAVDFSAGILQMREVNIYIIEAILSGIAVISLFITVKIRPLFGDSRSIPKDPAEQAVSEGY